MALDDGGITDEPLRHAPHEVDPAPGGIELVAKLHIGGTGGQTETTVNAVRQEVHREDVGPFTRPKIFTLRVPHAGSLDCRIHPLSSLLRSDPKTDPD